MQPKIELRTYQTLAGKRPFDDWLEDLRDRKARYVIRARLDRLTYGLAGKCEPVGQGIFELKIYYGPGYRVYFGQKGQTLVILLCGGDKSTQSQDIERAQSHWQDYQRRR